MVNLVISDNEGTTTVVPLVRDEITIGRKDGNTIRLTERNVSRHHCTLQRVNGHYVVRDHGSYNGVVVNGKRVERESALHPGDQVQIGDYTLRVEDEAASEAASPATLPAPSLDPGEVSEVEPTRVAPMPRPPLSGARLVVLTAPLAGAEFSLPERGELRIGRADDLEITLDHRSVSREHARIAADGEHCRVIDRASSNGVLVNGERVTEARLAAGDVLELGEVLVRYVAPGEHYVFDPREVRTLQRARRGPSRGPMLLAGGIVAAALVLAFAIVRGGSEPEPAQVQSSELTGVAPSTAEPSEDARFQTLLDSCRGALAGERFAEAMAHAQQALKLRPAAADAAGCHTQARALHEQEQALVRAKSAFEARDMAAAESELQTLVAGSPLVQRPEAVQLLDRFGEARVAEAEKLLDGDVERAAAIARGVLRVPLLGASHRSRAEAVLAAARNKLRDAREPREVREPRVPTARSARPRPAEAAPHAASESRSPLEIASECLAKGDNACVVRALHGKAETAQELGLLIETYRAMGNTAQAQKHMAMYVLRFPTARRSDAYRQMLERH